MSPSVTFHCDVCGSVVSYNRDLQHDRCPGCRRAFEVLIKVVDPGQPVGRLVKERWVPVKG